MDLLYEQFIDEMNTDNNIYQLYYAHEQTCIISLNEGVNLESIRKWLIKVKNTIKKFFTDVIQKIKIKIQKMKDKLAEKNANKMKMNIANGKKILVNMKVKEIKSKEYSQLTSNISKVQTSYLSKLRKYISVKEQENDPSKFLNEEPKLITKVSELYGDQEINIEYFFKETSIKIITFETLTSVKKAIKECRASSEVLSKLLKQTLLCYDNINKELNYIESDVNKDDISNAPFQIACLNTFISSIILHGKLLNTSANIVNWAADYYTGLMVTIYNKLNNIKDTTAVATV